MGIDHAQAQPASDDDLPLMYPAERIVDDTAKAIGGMLVLLVGGFVVVGALLAGVAWLICR